MAKAEKTKSAKKKVKDSSSGVFTTGKKSPNPLAPGSPDWSNLLELRERRLAVSYRKK